MPHGPFRRVVAPDPNNGIRGDLVRPERFNELQRALEDSPSNADVAGTAGVTPGDYRTALSWTDTGEPAKNAIPVSPLIFGQVAGDGVTDDTAGILDYFDKLGIGPDGSDFGDARGIILDGQNRLYAISDPVLIDRCWYVHMRNFRFIVIDAIEAGLDLYGVSYSKFENIHIRADSDWSASHTCDYPFRIESAQNDPGNPKPVAAQNTFANCTVLGVKHKIAYAIGIDSANLQVSETSFHSCMATGQYNTASPDATWYQAGWKAGSGTSGNILTHQTFGCTAGNYKYPLHVNATDFKWFGGSLDGGESAIYFSSAAPLTVIGLRSENSKRLLETPTAVGAPAFLANVVYSGNNLNADGYLILWQNTYGISVNGLIVDGVTASDNPKVRHNNASANIGQYAHIKAPVAEKDFFSISGATPAITSFGYIQVDDAYAFVAASDGLHFVGQSALRAFTLGSAPDAKLYRNGSYPGWTFAASRTFDEGTFEFWIASTTSNTIRNRHPSEADFRYTQRMDGRETWGDGTNPMDAGWERGAADRMTMLAGDAFRTGAIAALPTAASGYRGYTYRIEGASGVADVFAITDKNEADAYTWRQSSDHIVSSKSASFTAGAASSVYLCNAASGAITVTLPAVSGIASRSYVIKKTDNTNNVVVDGNASETIDGATTKTITTQYGFIEIVCDGSAWHIVASGGTIT